MELIPNNILLIRLKSMGDVLFTLPAVHRIRENFPETTISFLVSKEQASLIGGFREVQHVITLDRGVFRRGRPGPILKESWSLLRKLRQGKFALTVDFQGYGETALLTWCSRARQRWGGLHGGGRRWAYTRVVPRNDHIHPAEWNLSLLEQCGLRGGNIVNQFVLPAADLELAHSQFMNFGLKPDRPTLFIQPFTSTPHKNWPLENYLMVAAHWRNAGNQVLFASSPDQRAALEPVRREGYPISFGPLLLDAGLVQLSSIVLGSDTGLLHLASALGKRVVMIMVSTRPGRCYPFQHPDWAVTPPLGRGHPISTVPPERVIQACAGAIADLKIEN